MEKRNYFKKLLALSALLLALTGMGAPQLTVAAEQSLEEGFRNPPESAKAQTWWHWMNGNITKEGITADLEAMKTVGVGGAHIFSVTTGIVPGPVTMMTPEFFALTTHAAKEAARLGIELGMHNCPGWSTSGGPWVKPEQSMQMVVWSEARAKGPSRFEAVLAQPQTIAGHYRDIALLAFPTPPEEGPSMAEAGAKITLGETASPLDPADAAKLMDGNAGYFVKIGAARASGKVANKADNQQMLTIEFPAPFTARSLTLAFEKLGDDLRGTIEVSDDGLNFRSVNPFALAWPIDSVNFEKVKARHFRLKFSGETVLGEVVLSGAARLEDMPARGGYHSESPYFSTAPAFSADGVIRRESILDLSGKMDPQGRLVWDVPPGNWTLLRIGHTSTGRENHPSPESGKGLECDKLSKTAVEAHFAGYIGKVLEAKRPEGIKGLANITVDSWEARSQNWTPGFAGEFRRRMGYELLPYLPVFTGRPVESAETSERFLWDLRRTVADMLVENFAGRLRELCHENGLALTIEGYGSGPLDSLAYAGRGDIPQSEFWAGAPLKWIWNKQMASVAHTYGKLIVGAEAFTANAEGRWMNHPFQLKPLGDEAFTMGINRLVFHRYAHQPWLDRKPGMTMGTFGLHFERTNTWWDQCRAWLAYLARCQYLLQQGKFVADIACLMPEQTHDSYYLAAPSHVNTPPGYDLDALSAELLNQMSVRQGRLTLPSGMSYQVLVLPNSPRMRLAQLRKIKELVEAGAVVCGPAPRRSPSLADGPDADAEVRRLADELWGDCDGVEVLERPFGKGRIVSSIPGRVLWTPDFSVLGAETGKPVRFIHRKAGNKDIYFLASSQGEATTFYCNFRVSGKTPELWHPDSGRIEKPAIYEKVSGMTRIPIRFEPYGSVFVVFSDDKPDAEPVVSVRRDGGELICPAKAKAVAVDFLGKLDRLSLTVEKGGYRLETTRPGAYQLKTDSGKVFPAVVGELPMSVEIEGPWDVFFPKGLGAPEHVQFAKLISWPTHPDQGVKYFSGTATYRKVFDLPAVIGDSLSVIGKTNSQEQITNNQQPITHNQPRMWLDLGRVAVMAEVKLNGKELGILWKPPYTVDITKAARAGANELEVRVVNLWPNRLIGDEQLPEDSEHNAPGGLKKWPSWLLEGKPSPTGRLTFATWKHWNKDDPLLESGLLGPVRLIPSSVSTIAIK
jgi:hypothetical protein